jgi:glycosyltransferase involved in cell wall biosynthesis
MKSSKTIQKDQQPEAIIDVTRLLNRTMQSRLPTGVDRVSLEYVRHFGDRSTALVRFSGQWIELSRRSSEQVFDALLSPCENFNYLIRKVVARSLPCNIGKQFLSPRLLFNTGHSGLDKIQYSHRLQQSGLKPLFFVHDLIPLTHPEYCRPGEADKHRARINTILKTGHGVIVNSEATLRELTSYAQTHDFPMPPAMVALLASAQFPEPVANTPLSKPYFVMLGTIEPRKNHWLMLQLWRQLVEQFGDAAPRLVIIGQRGWECENVVDLLDRCEALKGFVVEESCCTDAQVATWLHHAQALLFPSFAEGYGMPLAEALSVGLPVIASDLPAFREIAGGIPEYLDPLDVMQWKQLIMDYTNTMHPRRCAQLERLRTFRPPTWISHFAQVEALLEVISGQRV